MSPTTEALIIALPILFLSMALHEMMHAVAAYWLGDDTARLQGRISANPIRHIDPIMTIALPLLLILLKSPVIFGAAKPVQVNFMRLRWGEYGGAVVGMIGPLTNLAIAMVAGLAFTLIDPDFGLSYKILGWTVLINAGFFVFNSIPFPPLDGSRLLYAFAPRGLQEFMNSIERMGVNALLIFFLLFYYISPSIGRLISSLVSVIAPGLNLNLLL